MLHHAMLYIVMGMLLYGMLYILMGMLLYGMLYILMGMLLYGMLYILMGMLLYGMLHAIALPWVYIPFGPIRGSEGLIYPRRFRYGPRNVKPEVYIPPTPLVYWG